MIGPFYSRGPPSPGRGCGGCLRQLWLLPVGPQKGPNPLVIENKVGVSVVRHLMHT